MTGKLALLHKGGPKSDMASQWRPVVLLNCTNQIIAYIVNERHTEMVENAHILSQAQGGFRQNESTDINGCKLYGITNEAQRLKKRFLRVDIDFKSEFNIMIISPCKVFTSIKAIHNSHLRASAVQLAKSGKEITKLSFGADLISRPSLN